jgi:hypothetical protein
MHKILIALALALSAAACSISPGNWPGGPTLTIKPGTPPPTNTNGDKPFVAVEPEVK